MLISMMAITYQVSSSRSPPNIQPNHSQNSHHTRKAILQRTEFTSLFLSISTYHLSYVCSRSNAVSTSASIPTHPTSLPRNNSKQNKVNVQTILKWTSCPSCGDYASIFGCPNSCPPPSLIDHYERHGRINPYYPLRCGQNHTGPCTTVFA